MNGSLKTVADCHYHSDPVHQTFRTDGENGMATQRMPDIWGMRTNPIAGILPDIDLMDEEDDDDSLGNLSEFEDADFEVCRVGRTLS
jgi:hypothetical protein